MPKIPNYSDDAPVPLHVPLAEGSNFRLAPVKPDSTVDFGAQASGKAFEAIGGLANQLAIRAQALDNQKQTTDALAVYNRGMGNLSKDLMSRQGQMVEAADATDTTPARDSIVTEYSKRSAQLYEDCTAGIKNPVVLQKFRESALSTENTYALQITQHYNEQHSAAQQESNNALISVNNSNMVTALQNGDFKTFRALQKQNDNYQWQNGMLKGTTDAAMKLERQSNLATVATTAVNYLATTNPQGGMDVLKEIGSELPQAVRDDLYSKLTPKIEQTNIKAYGDQIIKDHPELIRNGRFDEAGYIDLMTKAAQNGQFNIKTGGGSANVKAGEYIGGQFGWAPQLGFAVAQLEGSDSELATKYHNHFGIKYTGQGEYVEMPTEEIGEDGVRRTVMAKFQVFDSDADGSQWYVDWMRKNCTPDELASVQQEFQNNGLNAGLTQLAHIMKVHSYYTDHEEYISPEEPGYAQKLIGQASHWDEQVSVGEQSVQDPDIAAKIKKDAQDRAAYYTMQFQQQTADFSAMVAEGLRNHSWNSPQEAMDAAERAGFNSTQIQQAGDKWMENFRAEHGMQQIVRQERREASKDHRDELERQMNENGVDSISDQDIKDDPALTWDDVKYLQKERAVIEKGNLQWRGLNDKPSAIERMVKSRVKDYADNEKKYYAQNGDTVNIDDTAKLTMEQHIYMMIDQFALDHNKRPSYDEASQIVTEELAGHRVNAGLKSRFVNTENPNALYEPGDSMRQ